MTLVRARLWPATPQNPHYAFCFDLLDWAEALLLECQVSLKDLCEALYFKCPHLVIKVSLFLFKTVLFINCKLFRDVMYMTA